MLDTPVSLHFVMRHDQFVVFFYCKIMLNGINYTYYSILMFSYPIMVFEIDIVRGRLLNVRGVFETVVGVAKSPEGNA